MYISSVLMEFCTISKSIVLGKVYILEPSFHAYLLQFYGMVCFQFSMAWHGFYMVWFCFCLCGVFSSHSRIFHSFGDVIRLQILLATMAIEQCGFFSMPHLMWYGASIYNSHLRGPLTQWSCHYPLCRHRSVAARIRTLNFLLVGRIL